MTVLRKSLRHPHVISVYQKRWSYKHIEEKYKDHHKPHPDFGMLDLTQTDMNMILPYLDSGFSGYKKNRVNTVNKWALEAII